MTASASIDIGRFSTTGATALDEWQIIQLDKDISATQYQVIEWDQRTAIEAIADRSMALLGRPLVIDLKSTPILCWQWRVDKALDSADMTKKSGDDYAARVYVAFDLEDDALSWGTRLKLGLARNIYGDQVPDAAINYVWDNQQPIDYMQANAYTDRAQMFVVQSGNQKADTWVAERRNVLADATKAFGDLQFTAQLLAVAADTDNTGEQARSGFADLHFVKTDEACNFSPI